MSKEAPPVVFEPLNGATLRVVLAASLTLNIAGILAGLAFGGDMAMARGHIKDKSVHQNDSVILAEIGHLQTEVAELKVMVQELRHD